MTPDNPETQRDLNVLIVEDSDDDALLIRQQLEAAGYLVTLARVDTREALIAALRRQRWDIVFSDFSMPQFDGMGALQTVREHDPDLPFLVVSGTIGEERAVMLMKQGAQDYLLKGNIKRLIPAVERELREARVRREHGLAQEHIRRIAYYDPLTQLPNRQRLLEDLELYARRAAPVGLAVVDLIDFREVNETLGYSMGDELLREAARRLQELDLPLRGRYRVGGNEFAVLLDTDARERVEAAAQGIFRALGTHYVSAGFRIRLSARIGAAAAACSPGSSLLQRASTAVTLARRDGRTFAWYEAERDPSNPQSLGLLADLHDAVGTEQLSLVFQPKVQCGTGLITGCEALLRWRHPEHGLISPETFIPMAEKSGLIDDIARHVVASVLDVVLTQRRRGRVLPVAINLSPRNLLNAPLMNDILEAALGRDSEVADIEIEMTETALMHDPDRAIDILDQLHRAGVRLYIDDFGTGFSSLGYLAKLPIHAIKIDKSFVQTLEHRPQADTIVRSTIALAHNLGLQVVAEGVENATVWNRLTSYRCDEAQGYYFSEPLPIAAFDALQRRWVPPAVAGSPAAD